jgi:hypothetical protein
MLSGVAVIGQAQTVGKMAGSRCRFSTIIERAKPRKHWCSARRHLLC